MRRRDREVEKGIKTDRKRKTGRKKVNNGGKREQTLKVK